MKRLNDSDLLKPSSDKPTYSLTDSDYDSSKPGWIPFMGTTNPNKFIAVCKNATDTSLPSGKKEA